MKKRKQGKGVRLLAIGILLVSGATSSRGAVEISVPGDHQTIQSAIAAAEPGDTVVVAAGRYREQVRLAKGVTLRSAGGDGKGKRGLARAEATMIDAGGKAPAVTMAEGSSLDGLTVTGAGKFDQAEFDKHFAERGENLPDERGAAGADGNSAAIAIDGVSVRVLNCIIHDNGHPGIALAGEANRSEILDNHVYRNMGGGIGIANGAKARVANNRCWENLRAGIGCRASSPLVEGNHCFQNTRAGIGIREGATPLVRSNDCHHNQRAGIGVRMAGTEPVLRANRCHENGMAGIGCRDGAAPLMIGNECFKNRLAGIGAMSNAQPVIIGNKIYENEAAAIGLSACDSGRALIRGNTVTAKSLVAFGIQSGWSVRIEDNTIRRDGGLPPLAMVFEGAVAEFTGNRLQGSGVAAIRCQGQAFVSGNQFDCPAPRKGGPPQHAVWALEGSFVSMSDENVIRGWRGVAQPPAVRVKTRKELDAALGQAKPGTTILIASGNYEGGISVRDLRGEKGRPIVIAGADRKNPPVFSGGNSGFHLVAPDHVELRNLVIEKARGNGINIDDGGNAENPASHLKLSGLVVRDIDGRGNRDGIKLSGVTDFQVENCRVERWGSGGSGIDMVGCHRGFIDDSIFVHNKDAIGANGVQTKGGSSKIAIRRCRFENAGGRGVNLGGSTGAAYFRPADTTSEASDISVTDSFFKGSGAAVAFVGVDRGVVRNNTIYRPGRWALRILQENTGAKFVQCRNGVFEKNIIAFRSGELRSAVNIGANTNPETFRFSDNVWICLDKPEVAKRMIQLPSKERGGVFGLKVGAAQIDRIEKGELELTGEVVRIPGVGARLP